jgi:DNA replication licensing factor MCM6
MTQLCHIPRRFDLMHVMIDQPDEDHDRAVAGHILAVHQLKPAALSARYSMAQMQRYIKYVRAIKPQLSEAVSAPPLAECSLHRQLQLGCRV